MNVQYRSASFVAALMLSACAQSSTHALPPSAPAEPPSNSAGGSVGKYIKHVVVIVQENRSFDNLFAGFPGADGAMSGRNSKGKTIKLHAIPMGDKTGDMAHTFQVAVRSWDHGKMDQFDLNSLYKGGPVGTYPYSYVSHGDIRPYWAMARQYVLADHMFPTEWGSSFTAHQDLIAGTTILTRTSSVADNPTDSPWGCDAAPGTVTNRVLKPKSGIGPGTVSVDTGPFPCYTHVTIADALDANHVSWRYYAPEITQPGGNTWTAFDAIRKVRYGPDWKYVVSPPSAVLTAASGGSLASVVWVIPDHLNSDHPDAESKTGPSWVASVVNAVGKSKSWDSTAIVLLWDDWGAWYDNVPPPQLDYTGLGLRVPCIIISPYAKHGYVDHTQYEYGSILKFIEQVFGLPSIGTSDARAASLVNAFDFTEKPRKFQRIPQVFSTDFFLKQKPSYLPVDTE